MITAAPFILQSPVQSRERRFGFLRDIRVLSTLGEDKTPQFRLTLYDAPADEHPQRLLCTVSMHLLCNWFALHGEGHVQSIHTKLLRAFGKNGDRHRVVPSQSPFFSER